MDTFTIISIVVMCASIGWSLSMLIFAAIKKYLQRKKAKKQIEDDYETN